MPSAASFRRRIPTLRALVRGWLRGSFLASRRDLGELLGRAPILVVAPHPDDETIGCGGVIMLRRRSEADVHIAFLTDGAESHGGHGHTPDGLRALRRAEAGEAARVLGVPHDCLHFLDHPDGRVAEQRERITADLVDVLRRCEPAAVFIPHADERPVDHKAARLCALDAISRWGRRVQVFEYGVWCWVHWPWVRLLPGPGGWARAILRRTLATGFGVLGLRAFNVRVDISDVTGRKRQALMAHASQWESLTRVAEGAFLERMLEDFEAFRAYHVDPNGDPLRSPSTSAAARAEPPAPPPQPGEQMPHC